MNAIPGLMPGEIVSYDGDSRSCKVRIPGITDGSTDLPVAQLCSDIGDDPDRTEKRIRENKLVWLMFEAGDARYPVIMGWRTPRAGNPVDWLRWDQKNIEMSADQEFVMNGKTLTMNFETVTINASATVTANTPMTTLNGNETVNGATELNGDVGIQAGEGGSGHATLRGGLDVTGGQLTHNGRNVGDTHTHGGVEPGPGSSGTPN